MVRPAARPDAESAPAAVTRRSPPILVGRTCCFTGRVRPVPGRHCARLSESRGAGATSPKMGQRRVMLKRRRSICPQCPGST